MNFDKLDLSQNLKNAINELGFQEITKIQELSIPIILDGYDLIGISNTGSGKTAAFSLPILELMIRNGVNSKSELKTIILAPTRELVSQIYKEILGFSKYLDLNIIYSHGGIEIEKQRKDFERKNQILITTPKRLVDLIEEKIINTSNLDNLIVDEIDIILEQDSKNNFRKIIKQLPRNKQSLFFSATLNEELKGIEYLKEGFKEVIISENKININSIKQYIYYVDKENKFKLLLNILRDKKIGIKSALIFLNDKKDVDNLVRFLKNNGIFSSAFHSAKSNVHREKVLKQFKEGELKYLISTDIASRGLDIINLNHVVNFDIPFKTKDYIHRIGRVGRAGSSGKVFNLCSASEKESMNRIEKLLNLKLENIKHDYHSHSALKGLNKKQINKKNKLNKKKNKKKTSVDFSKWLKD